MSAIFDIISNVLKIIVNILKGDQPKRSEVESATSDLEQENKNLEKQLEEEIKKKEKIQK